MARLVEGSLGAPLSIEQIGCEENNLSAFSDSWPNSQFNNWQQACMAIFYLKLFVRFCSQLFLLYS